MKSKDFGSILKALGETLSVAGAHASIDLLTQLASVFDANPTLSVAQLVERLSKLPKQQNSGVHTLGDVARILSPLRALFVIIGKAASIADFESVQGLLRVHHEMDPRTLLQAATRVPTSSANSRRGASERSALSVSSEQGDLVAGYGRRLEASLGNEEDFMAIYNDLCANKAIKVAEAKALAKQLTKITASSKKEAFQRILSRHQTLMTFKAKDNATGGRSAA